MADSSTTGPAVGNAGTRAQAFAAFWIKAVAILLSGRRTYGLFVRFSRFSSIEAAASCSSTLKITRDTLICDCLSNGRMETGALVLVLVIPTDSPHEIYLAIETAQKRSMSSFTAQTKLPLKCRTSVL